MIEPGDRIGNFLVIRLLPSPGRARCEVECQLCGGRAEKQVGNLRRDYACSKPCFAAAMAREHIGERYGRMTIIDITDERHQGAIRYLCRCDDGETTLVCLPELRSGNTQSCGCIQRERASETSTRHGMWGTPIYYVWRAMIRRCHDPRDPAYEHYGARGIRVCERWRQSVEAFVADVEALPRQAHSTSLDRIDNDGNYEPGNLQWATQREQVRNTRRNVHVDVGGGARILVDAQRESGVQPATYYARVARGATVAEALATPVRTQLRSGGIRGTHRSMMRRCHGRLGEPLRKNYGDRGIAVHEPWRDYATFRRDMLATFGGDLPLRIAAQNLDLDRKDPEGDYEPGNIEWIPRGENARRHRPGKLPPPTRPPSPSLVVEAVQEETCRHCGGVIPEERRERGRLRNAPVYYCARKCNQDAANARHRKADVDGG